MLVRKIIFFLFSVASYFCIKEVAVAEDSGYVKAVKNMMTDSTYNF